MQRIITAGFRPYPTIWKRRIVQESQVKIVKKPGSIGTHKTHVKWVQSTRSSFLISAIEYRMFLRKKYIVTTVCGFLKQHVVRLSLQHAVNCWIVQKIFGARAKFSSSDKRWITKNRGKHIQIDYCNGWKKLGHLKGDGVVLIFS